MVLGDIIADTCAHTLAEVVDHMSHHMSEVQAMDQKPGPPPSRSNRCIEWDILVVYIQICI